jgi:hypothetical protein
MFLTNTAFREPYGTNGPVTIWLNLESKDQVDELHQRLARTKAKILSERKTSPGTCANSGLPIPTAIGFACLTISPGSLEPAEAGWRA